MPSIHLDGGVGKLYIRESSAKDSITLDGAKGSVVLRDTSGMKVVFLESSSGDGSLSGLFLGANGKPGILAMRDRSGRNSIDLNGVTGNLNLYNEDGKRSLSVQGKAIDGKSAGMWIGAHPHDSLSGAKAGYLEIRKALHPLRAGTGLIPILIALQ